MNSGEGDSVDQSGEGAGSGDDPSLPGAGADDSDANIVFRRRRRSNVGGRGDGDRESFSTVTQKDDDAYDVTEGARLAIVLNHRSYPADRDLSARNGTEPDAMAIRDTFGRLLGFQVFIYDDLRFGEIQALLRQLQSSDADDLACVAIFVLTHGEENGTLQAYDMPYRLDKHLVDELVPSRCPSLAGKPKMIFVQACQGQKGDSGTEVKVRSRHTSHDGPNNCGVYRIPHYADFLIFQASYYDHYAFRSRSGSWFIQALCHSLGDSDESHEIHAVLNRAKRIVALDKVSNVPGDPELHEKKQIPLVQDTLIRDLYLKRVQAAEDDDEKSLSQEIRNLATTDKTKKKKRGDKCTIM